MVFMMVSGRKKAACLAALANGGEAVVRMD
jgi:hypothetical protein